MSKLADWRSPTLYDVVYSVDVLFHLVDGADSRTSLDNLASLVRIGGKLVISDERNDVQAPARELHPASHLERVRRRPVAAWVRAP